MADYILREAAIAAIKKDIMGGLNYERILNSIPAADVQPVKHGRWAANIFCSNCGWYMEDDVTLSPMMVFFNYCPNFGAKMDGEA